MMVPSVREQVGLTPEIRFARKLADKEKRIRDSVINKLRRWLAARSESKKEELCEDELLRVWKGLFYCLWMQDKLLLQEELCSKMSEMTLHIKSSDIHFRFLKAFYITLSREWSKIDVFRMDKFMLLVRGMFRHSLVYVSDCVREGAGYNAVIDAWCGLMREVCSGSIPRGGESGGQAVVVPTGLRIHVIDVYVEEMKQAAATALTHDVIINLLQPVITLLREEKDKCILRKVEMRVFHELIMTSPLGRQTQAIHSGQEPSPPTTDTATAAAGDDDDCLQIDFHKLSDVLFSTATSPDDGNCSAVRYKNRRLLYDLVNKCRDVSNGIYPLVDYVSSGSDIDDEDIDKSVRTLIHQEEQSDSGNGEDKGGEDAVLEGDKKGVRKVKRKKKKLKKKVEENIEKAEKKIGKIGKKKKKRKVKKVVDSSRETPAEAVVGEVPMSCSRTMAPSDSSSGEVKVSVEGAQFGEFQQTATGSDRPPEGTVPVFFRRSASKSSPQSGHRVTPRPATTSSQRRVSRDAAGMKQHRVSFDLALNETFH